MKGWFCNVIKLHAFHLRYTVHIELISLLNDWCQDSRSLGEPLLVYFSEDSVKLHVTVKVCMQSVKLIC